MSWKELCQVASCTQMSGIELYDIAGPVFAGKSSPANPELSAVTRRELAGAGLALPCIGTVNDFTDPAFKQE